MKLVIVRGDHRVNEVKLGLRAEVTTSGPPAPTRWRERLGPPGFIGPVGTDLPILLDAGRRAGRLRHRRQPPDAHLRGVEPGRDFQL